MINRLVTPSAGRVLIDGEDTASVPEHELRRRIGYAIQGHGLFPHRSVAENIATVPRLLGWPKARIDARVEELLDGVPARSGRVRAQVPAPALRRPAAARRASRAPWPPGRTSC